MSIGIAEAAFRILRPGKDLHPDYPFDPHYHHRLAPDTSFHQRTEEFDVTSTTNHLSLRGSADIGPKVPGVRRILMLGDSFTFGVGVQDDQTFCAVLQRALEARQARVEIVNAGMGSYSPILHYLTLRDLYLPLKPDAVILWFDFSDLQDDFLYARRLLYDAHGQPVACNRHYLDGRWDWGLWLLEHSALAAYLYKRIVPTVDRLRILGVREYLRVKRSGQRTKTAVINVSGERRTREDLLAYDRYLMIRDRAALPEIERHWQLTGDYILRMRDLLREHGVPFVLAVYPYGVQVGPNQWARGRQPYGFEPGRTYDDPFPFELLETFARQHDIPFINTWPWFLAAKDQPLFYDWDGHFTATAHRLVADQLLDEPAFRKLLVR